MERRYDRQNGRRLVSVSVFRYSGFSRSDLQAAPRAALPRRVREGRTTRERGRDYLLCVEQPGGRAAVSRHAPPGARGAHAIRCRPNRTGQRPLHETGDHRNAAKKVQIKINQTSGSSNFSAPRVQSWELWLAYANSGRADGSPTDKLSDVFEHGARKQVSHT